MTWGLVLSGGTAAGIANGGVLEVLDREQLRPDFLAGSSMGAIIGALYAYGIPVSTIHELTDRISLTNIAAWTGPTMKEGLHGGLLRQRIEEHLSPLVGDATIGDCRLPFVCIAGRVIKPIQWTKILGDDFLDHVRECIERYVFPSETRLIDAIVASSAMPMIFKPAEVNGQHFVDLIAFGAIPARTLQEIHHPQVTVCTDTNPVWEDVMDFLPTGWKEFLRAGYDSLEESKDACDLVIRPPQPHGPFRFDKAEDFWQAGMKAAEGKVEEMKKLLS